VHRPYVTSLLESQSLDALVAVGAESLVWTVGFEVFEGPWNKQTQVVVIPSEADAPVVVLMPASELARTLDTGVDQRAHVIPVGGLPALNEPSGRWGDRLEVLAARAKSDLGGALAAALDAAGLSGSAAIAVETSAEESIRSAVGTDRGVDLLPGGEDLLYLARQVKGPEEITLIRTAADVLQTGMRKVLDQAGSLTLAEAGRMFSVDVAAEGGYVAHMTLDDAGVYRNWGVGTSGRYEGAPGRVDEVLSVGTRARWDAGIVVGGYWADLGGTFVIGVDPDPDDAKIYDAIAAGVEAGVASARPGARISEVYESAITAVREAGISDYAMPSVGHGIGVRHMDGPVGPAFQTASRFLSNPHDLALEGGGDAGTVINIEVPFNVPGAGGFQYEVTCAVLASGPQLLSGRRILEML
jgi:Xaa-Pro aminopeptidase